MLMRYRLPTVALDDLRREMENVFDAFGTRSFRPWFRRAAAQPALNIWDAGDALCVEAEVPGVKEEDLEILVMGNELTIKGRRSPLEGADNKYHRQERATGEFVRALTLPARIDSERIEAALKHGVLTLRLPKAESDKPRKITVKTA